MERSRFGVVVFLMLMSLLPFQNVFSCSGYKITMGRKTILGCNEDAWRLTPRLWFENARGNSKYGAAFTGSRYDGDNGFAPQAGMNEMGLAFERLASYHPGSVAPAGRMKITNPTQYLKDIMHRCSTVEEVKTYISNYDHSFFIEDVFIYVDKSGKYLVVEPYTLITGNDATYVISNFCPSITSAQHANHLERYRNGVDFLKTKLDTTPEFCVALSDTMHVCREKIGDGTLLTSIWDVSNGTFNLYFYHQYDRTVHYNLAEELKKGDRLLAIDVLFPPNPEFEQLRNFKTPKNSNLMGVFIVASGGLFLFSALLFLYRYLRRENDGRYERMQLLLFPPGLILFYYMYVLSGSVNVFYFSAPYKDPSNVFVSLSSYIPFLLAAILLPLWLVNYRLIRENGWTLFARSLFTLNNLVYSILVGLFVYWGFYGFSV